MKLKEIISALPDVQVVLNSESEITEPVELDVRNTRKDVIFWCNDKYAEKISQLKAGTVICSKEAAGDLQNKNINYLIVVRPRLCFLKVMELFANNNNSDIDTDSDNSNESQNNNQNLLCDIRKENKIHDNHDKLFH